MIGFCCFSQVIKIRACLALCKHLVYFKYTYCSFSGIVIYRISAVIKINPLINFFDDLNRFSLCNAIMFVWRVIFFCLMEYKLWINVMLGSAE